MARDPSNRVSGDPRAVALGQRLFFEPRLSSNGAIACATCHVPERAWTDGRPRAMGLDRLDRNTPTVLANGKTKVTKKSSIFGKLGLNLRLVREDVFAKQLDAYLAGRSPYLRGTLGMVNMAAEAAGRDARTKPVVIYQLTWSAGGVRRLSLNVVMPAMRLARAGSASGPRRPG